MGDEPSLSIIQPVTIKTMLNSNWLNNGPIYLSKKSGLISLCVNVPLVVVYEPLVLFEAPDV